MKTSRSSILCLVVLLLTAPLLRAQDLSKYRHFTLGMNLTKLMELTNQKMADVKMIHGRPALIQELTWWPPNVPGTSLRSNSVEQIHFSFYNGELYRISVTYDRPSTEGLTEADMVKSISAKYGPATIVAPEANAQAELAIAEAVKLEEQEGPKRDAERQKKLMVDLELARQKNQKSFRP